MAAADPPPPVRAGAWRSCGAGHAEEAPAPNADPGRPRAQAPGGRRWSRAGGPVLAEEQGRPPETRCVVRAGRGALEDKALTAASAGSPTGRKRVLRPFALHPQLLGGPWSMSARPQRHELLGAQPARNRQSLEEARRDRGLSSGPVIRDAVQQPGGPRGAATARAGKARGAPGRGHEVGGVLGDCARARAGPGEQRRAQGGEALAGRAARSAAPARRDARCSAGTALGADIGRQQSLLPPAQPANCRRSTA